VRANRDFILLAVNNHDRLEALNKTAAHVISQMLQMLPAKRDWLDPDIEKLARSVLKEVEEQRKGNV